jgi:hypothetical protein
MGWDGASPTPGSVLWVSFGEARPGCSINGTSPSVVPSSWRHRCSRPWRRTRRAVCSGGNQGNERAEMLASSQFESIPSLIAESASACGWLTGSTRAPPVTSAMDDQLPTLAPLPVRTAYRLGVGGIYHESAERIGVLGGVVTADLGMTWASSRRRALKWLQTQI